VQALKRRAVGEIVGPAILGLVAGDAAHKELAGARELLVDPLRDQLGGRVLKAGDIIEQTMIDARDDRVDECVELREVEHEAALVGLAPHLNLEFVVVTVDAMALVSFGNARQPMGALGVIAAHNRSRHEMSSRGVVYKKGCRLAGRGLRSPWQRAKERLPPGSEATTRVYPTFGRPTRASKAFSSNSPGSLYFAGRCNGITPIKDSCSATRSVTAVALESSSRKVRLNSGTSSWSRSSCVAVGADVKKQVAAMPWRRPLTRTLSASNGPSQSTSV
jgi:hypothetical protein